MYTLLAGGYRSSIATLSFDPSGTLKLVSESPVPASPSWIELDADKQTLWAVSELEADGSLVECKLVRDAAGAITGVEVLRDVVTGGAPCHIALDGERVLVANYMSGTLAAHDKQSLKPTITTLPYAYARTTPPDAGRQEAPHAHHAFVTPRGTLVCDLGSDRIYTVKDGEVVDFIQCEKGFGPRHVAVSPDGSTLYTLGELNNTVAVFPFPAQSSKDVAEIPSARANILPALASTKGMNAAELCSPVQGTVFASNRLSLHGGENANQKGDTVAVVLYDGNTVHEVKQVQTGLCCVRGMQVSPDGKYVAVAGQCKGGAEVYALEGEKRDSWKLLARLDIEKITDFVWV